MCVREREQYLKKEKRKERQREIVCVKERESVHKIKRQREIECERERE